MNTQIIKDYHDIKQGKGTVLVLGYFDALHLGHKTLFDQAREVADAHGLEVAVLTYHEAPGLAFKKFTPDFLLHLMSPQKRLEKFEEYGVDQLYLMDFTSEFAHQDSKAFIENYVGRLKADFIVVGFDYHFGCDRKTADDLEDLFDGQVITMPEFQIDEEKVSSTRIRRALANGNIVLVNQLLGYDFTTRGMVVHGDARGRTIGYPTANLAILDRLHLPSDGVYVTEAIVNGRAYRAMTSVGKNVTFDGQDLRVETHIFDFDQDIYGNFIEIVWLDKIRDMVKFSGIDELINALENDEKVALSWKKV
ncbi:bifunctional riboflavin kinase/FAD synthetase [Streptococcus caprae]|uniref:Riboflavin biosynthesis protein n=1 Tax=Streptococcus caprae TaxID=1640501 RepID=A0ABV8CXP4_9STRE